MKGVNMNLAFNLETIYEDANFQINENDKVGIIGVNGAGKTTLFKVILKELSLDSGSLTIEKNKRIGYLPQEIILSDEEITVLDYLLEARPIKMLEEKLTKLYEEVAVALEEEQNKILNQISKTQTMLEYYDVYNAEGILMEIISNMEIEDNLLDMKLADLSGGQKSKIAFAHLLYSNPEIMLLDEPTNHLDSMTREYITSYIKKYRGTVLIISHDIEFLNSIINKTLHIDKLSKKINIYIGNYNDYLKKASALKEARDKLIDKQEKEVDKLRSIVLQYSNSSGNRKKMAQSREKLLEKKLDNLITRDRKQKVVKLNIKPNREGSKIPIKVNNITFGYTEKNIIDNLSFVINSNERFLIVGANGAGKSTLLKLLVNELKLKEGNIWFGSKTDSAYYAQEQEELELDKTVLENVDSEGFSDKELRTVLGSFLFHGDEVFKKVKHLSPGERARIMLCKIMLKKANLLLLDEPTNHLDPDTQRIIGDNFKDYEGTIILVSHNPAFVENIKIDRILILPSGKITNYDKKILEHYHEMNNRS